MGFRWSGVKMWVLPRLRVFVNMFLCLQESLLMCMDVYGSSSTPLRVLNIATVSHCRYISLFYYLGEARLSPAEVSAPVNWDMEETVFRECDMHSVLQV